MSNYRFTVQAKMSGALPAHCLVVLYGRDWETCEGTRGLSFEEAREVMDSFVKDDKLACRELGMNTRRLPHVYRAVQEGEVEGDDE